MSTSGNAIDNERAKGSVTDSVFARNGASRGPEVADIIGSSPGIQSIARQGWQS